MDLEDFVSYCETPEVGATGKGTSYRNGIQYLCNYLHIDTSSFSSSDLNTIKNRESEISNRKSDFYKNLLEYLKNKGRRSYLESGFIRAALPYFYDFCKINGIE